MPAIIDRHKQKVAAMLLFGGLLAVCMLHDSLPVSLAFSNPSQTSSPDQAEFFEKQVRPILTTNCAACHNPKAKVAGLDLTTVEGFNRGGESGPIINKEMPAESRLLKVIGYDEKIKMPPSGKLSDDEIAVLAAWVKMGAPWPVAKTEAGREKWTNRPAASGFTDEQKQFWAFQPVGRPSPPKIRNTSWVKSPIDAFILQKLEEKNIKPAPAADKLTLIRRATLDLTGLPPTETEMRDFINDDSPDAFRKVVDRLLNSPRYGEKWGRHWLDVARYADSTGNDEDHRYPNAWKYRDYVIEAFNKDIPYDQFIREQLAGDLLAPSNSEGVNRRGIIATGFLAIGPKAIAQQDKKKMLYDVYDEQVDVTSKAFLGLTVSCARCHNHKFDPLLTKDYYSMVGIFAGTKSFSDPMAFVSESLNKPLVSKVEYDKYLEKKKAHDAQVKRRQLELGEIVDRVKEQKMSEYGARLAEFMVAAREVYQDNADLKSTAGKHNLPEDVLKKWVDYLKPGRVRQHLLEWQTAVPENLADVSGSYQRRFADRRTKWNEQLKEWRVKYETALKEDKELPDKPGFEGGKDRFFHEVYFGKEAPFSISQEDQSKFSRDEWQRITELRKEIEDLKKQAPSEPEMACAVEDGEIVNQKVFIRGDYHNEGEDAPKGSLSILADKTKQVSFMNGSGRLQLADWITQPEHPLTPRVMANRIWQWHFGEGIVRTPDNFGKMGERPTNPELLDFLARQFIESGWSTKSMHRLIMLSSAYQMSSGVSDDNYAADPDNRLLSRFNRRRLTVEEMRDGLLYLDGSLDMTMGGTLQTGTGTDGENANGRLSLNPEKLNRRTIYLPLRRANLPSLLNLFDFGDATTASGKRQLTNVATQALFWMNSEFMAERSKNFARTLIDRKDLSDEDRVKLGYLKLLNREASDEELRQSLGFIAGLKQKYSKQDIEAWQSFCRLLMSSNDYIYID